MCVCMYVCMYICVCMTFSMKIHILHETTLLNHRNYEFRYVLYINVHIYTMYVCMYVCMYLSCVYVSCVYVMHTYIQTYNIMLIY